MTTNEIIAALALELLKYDPAFVANLAHEINNATVPAPVAPKSEPVAVLASEKWYNRFKSATTTVKVLGSTVQVTVKRGHANEWHDELRASGFKWSKKNHNWWAYLDDEKRAEVAAHNIEVDKATEGMTDEQKREYWRARRAARTA